MSNDQPLNLHSNLSVCVDCWNFHRLDYGDFLESCEDAEARGEWIQSVSPDGYVTYPETDNQFDDSYEEFTARPCDLCLDTAAGERFGLSFYYFVFGKPAYSDILAHLPADIALHAATVDQQATAATAALTHAAAALVAKRGYTLTMGEHLMRAERITPLEDFYKAGEA